MAVYGATGIAKPLPRIAESYMEEHPATDFILQNVMHGDSMHLQMIGTSWIRPERIVAERRFNSDLTHIVICGTSIDSAVERLERHSGLTQSFFLAETKDILARLYENERSEYLNLLLNFGEDLAKHYFERHLQWEHMKLLRKERS